MINEASAERIASWIDDAVASGAELLAGGTREGTSVAPTLLANAPAQAKVSCEEVFGPVMTIAPVAGVDAALAAVNDPVRFAGGLVHPGPAGRFPAHRELLVGGWSSATPSFRADQMPYGGSSRLGSAGKVCGRR